MTSIVNNAAMAIKTIDATERNVPKWCECKRHFPEVFWYLHKDSKKGLLPKVYEMLNLPATTSYINLKGTNGKVPMKVIHKARANALSVAAIHLRLINMFGTMVEAINPVLMIRLTCASAQNKLQLSQLPSVALPSTLTLSTSPQVQFP